MGLVIDFLEPGPGDMRIDLGRRYVGVTKHFLHRPQVGPMFEQMRGERMPQHMRRYRYSDIHPPGRRLDDLPKTLPGHLATMMIEKQRVLRRPPDDFRPGPVQVVLQSQLRRTAHRHDALF